MKHKGKWIRIESSEHEQAQEALRFSDAAFRSIQESVIATDTEYTITHWNEVSERTYGIKAPEAIGRKLLDVIEIIETAPGENAERFKKLETQGYYQEEQLHRAKRSKVWVWVNVSIQAIGDNGKRQGWVVLASDVSEHKWVATELRAAEENFRNSLDSSPLGIRIVSAQGETLYANQAILDIYGYSSIEELRTTPTIQRYSPESYAEHQERKGKRKLGKFVPANYEVSIVRKDGEVRHLEVFRKEVLWDGTTQFQAIYHDITERKRAEEQARTVETLRERNRMKSDLLSTVSHEFRTPLATIKGYSTMLLDYDQRLDSDEKRQYLESIDRATIRLTGLVDNLLDMSRLEAGLLKLERKPTSISKLLKEAVEDAQLRAPKHRIVLKLRKGLPRLNVDARRTQQVLDNIIDNATKYSAEETEVVISAQRARRKLLLSIADQGIGIPAEELSKVFERMYRIQRSESSGTKGAGLGLAICKGLVEAHGGRIWAESEEGKGSTFLFNLPLDTKRGNSNSEGK